jgi:hypothetical protein
VAVLAARALEALIGTGLVTGECDRFAAARALVVEDAIEEFEHRETSALITQSRRG